MLVIKRQEKKNKSKTDQNFSTVCGTKFTINISIESERNTCCNRNKVNSYNPSILYL